MKSKKWLRRIIIGIGLSMIMLFGIITAVFAVGTITITSAIPTDTTISLTWTKSLSSDNTTIQYATSGYPATVGSGTTAYNGSSSYIQVSGLTQGTTYYFSAWAFDGSSYSASPAQIMVTTQLTISSNVTVPMSTPMIPTQAWQNPDISTWNIYPINNIIAWFADPTYAHGGLGMPINNVVMFMAGVAVTGVGLFCYIKWHNFFAAWFVVLVMVGFASAIQVMQWYVFGMMLLVGAGVWAVEHNFQ